MSVTGEGERIPRRRDRLYEVIFEAETPGGKAFDIALLLAILASVAAVMLDSVEAIRQEHGGLLRTLEWIFTILFTIEYALRILSVRRPWRYVTSFFGVVDLLAILPTYISVAVPGAQSLLAIRILRLLRVFRVLKLARFVTEAQVLSDALKSSARKIVVFVGGVIAIVVIMGALMYLIETPEHGFTSIPRSIYWAIVTMTTVGYGDLAPVTVTGQFLAAVIMILGYGVIAIPTGIVSVELVQTRRRGASTRVCRVCAAEGHDPDAKYCKYCGAALAPP